MNTKKIAAVIAAGTMLLATVPVSAAETATSASATVTSAGTVNAYDTTPIFEVTLPTANSLQFTVDPYGLLNLDTTGPGSKVNVDELANTGAIVAASGSGALIMNESSVPVTVGVKLSVSDDGGAIFVTDQADVATGDALNMLLALVPSASKVTVSGTAVTGYSEAGKVLAITDTTTPSSNNAEFYLAKAKYDVVNTGSGYKLKKTEADDNYDATMFKVGGAANPGADWSAYVATSSAAAISLEAVFSYTEATGSATTVDGVYGLVSGTAANLVDFTSGNDLKVTFSASESKAVTLASDKVKAIAITKNPAGANPNKTITTEATALARSGKQLTLKGSFFSGNSYELTVTYTDGTKDQKIIITR